jgi:hypothetical protein
MQSAEPTPLRYYPSPKEKLDFRRPKRRAFRIWPFAAVVLVLAGAIGGLMALMSHDARPGIALLVPPGTTTSPAAGG